MANPQDLESKTTNFRFESPIMTVSQNMPNNKQVVIETKR